MSYIISRAFYRFHKGYKQYLFIIIELAIGFTFIACHINVTASIKERLSVYERQYNNHGFSVDSYPKVIDPTAKNLSMDKEDYVYFTEKYDGWADISYLSYGNLKYHYIKSIPIIGMSDYAFWNLFHMDMQDRIYIGSHIIEKVREQEITTDDTNMHLSKEGLQIGEAFHPWYYLDETQDNITLLSFIPFAGHDWNISECIIIPIALKFQLEEYDIFNNNSFEVAFRQEISTYELVAERDAVISYLSEKHTGYEYKGVNKIDEYLSRSKSLSQSLEILSWVANYSLLLITAGIIGILLIILDKRKKDMSISLVAGAVKWVLYVELVLELFLLCISGSFLAIIASIIITPLLNTSQYQVTYNWRSVTLIMGMSLIITAFTSLILIMQIKIKNPVDTIREA